MPDTPPKEEKESKSYPVNPGDLGRALRLALKNLPPERWGEEEQEEPPFFWEMYKKLVPIAPGNTRDGRLGRILHKKLYAAYVDPVPSQRNLQTGALKRILTPHSAFDLFLLEYQRQLGVHTPPLSCSDGEVEEYNAILVAASDFATEPSASLSYFIAALQETQRAFNRYKESNPERDWYEDFGNGLAYCHNALVHLEALKQHYPYMLQRSHVSTTLHVFSVEITGTQSAPLKPFLSTIHAQLFHLHAYCDPNQPAAHKDYHAAEFHRHKAGLDSFLNGFRTMLDARRKWLAGEAHTVSSTTDLLYNIGLECGRGTYGKDDRKTILQPLTNLLANIARNHCEGSEVYRYVSQTITPQLEALFAERQAIHQQEHTAKMHRRAGGRGHGGSSSGQTYLV